MTSAQRVLVIVGLVVVAAIGFVVLKGTEDSSDDQPAPVVSAPASTATTPSGGGAAEQRAPAGRAARPAAPAVPTVVVRGGEPAGGVKELVFRSGDEIAFDVQSDAADEVHLHGYDVEQPVGPGAPARFRLKASIEGIFEAELHGSGTQIASIAVEP